MSSVIGFIFALFPLVVFHEFGHYLFARLFNVKAEIFSLGFGPKLLSKQWGETEFRLSAIPLGGFVKLLGEDPDKPLSPEESLRSLPKAKPFHRFMIFFGGPLFNFILATLVFIIILAIGEPQMASVIGRIMPESPAYQAGLRSGDKILAVGNKPISKFEELQAAIMDSPSKPLELKVQRKESAAPVDLTVTPSSEEGFNTYGEASKVGDLAGMQPMARANVIGISDAKSPAALAGIKTGYFVREINKTPIQNWEQVEAFYQGVESGAVLSFSVSKTASAKADTWISFQVKKPDGKLSLGKATGLYSSEMFVDKTVPDSPAREAGLMPGDRIAQIDGQDVQSFFDLRNVIQKHSEKSGQITLTWESATADGARMVSKAIKPTSKVAKDAYLRKTTEYTIGVYPQLVWDQPAEVVERVLNPVRLVWLATQRMIDLTGKHFISIGKMISGDISLNTLGGPILIGKIAGESLSRGVVAFLSMVAMLSIGLGVLNILPVPILDGGHMVLLTIEMIRGKPLTIRQTEFLQKAGLSMILALMAIVFWNDFQRLR